MASGGYDREVDVRVTCSICFEPYRGRFPKLLSCTHTFCLPCLTQLALATPTNRKPGIGDGATSGGNITCPTCRSLIPIPAGGVAAFQGNFYLFERDNETEPQPVRAGATCDICDSAQLAKYCCQKCQQKYCNRCQRCHDKLCSTGVPLAQRSNQQPQRAENSAASEEWQRKLNDLAQNFVVLQTANTLLIQNVTSLNDTQKKLSTEMTTQNDNHKKEMSALRNENATLSHDIMSLQKENNKLQQNMSAVQAESSKNASGVQSLTSQTESQKQEIQYEKKEISSLKDEGAKLRQDVSSLQKENSKLHQELAAFQAELSQRHRAQAADGSQAQQDLLQLRGDNKRLVADVKSLQTGQSRIGDQCEQVLTNYKQMEANLKGLQAKVSSLEKDVSKPVREETSSSDAAVPHAATSDVQDQIWDLPSTKKGNTKVNREKKSKKKRPQTFQNSESEKKEGGEESSPWLLVPSSSEGKDEDICPICLEPARKPKQLPCGHTFCTVCIEHAMSISPRCPKCLHVFGIIQGTQPRGGTMTCFVSWREALPGYEGCGTIVIQYYIPSGQQEACHPYPGRWYGSIQRTAYLPDNQEGNEVLKMLRKAFDHRLVFTIGDSATTGASGVITWNDIHHKTATRGGSERYGYPDPGYLKRVKEELAAKGITSPDP